jgi:hypothetical protein
LFIHRKEGTLRLCVDYRTLNKITIKNRYSLPRIEDLMNHLVGSYYFTKINLFSGYHQIRIKEENIPKTAFRTRYGHYEFLVMPFGLAHTSAIFMTLMNDIFREYLNQFIIVYLNNIMIYSKNKDEYTKHVKKVLEKLREHHLFRKLSKCEFFKNELEYLRHYISSKEILLTNTKLM